MACVNNHRCKECPTPCSTRMKNRYQLDFFTGIPISAREKITGVPYPQCTTVWEQMRRQEREEHILASGLYRLEEDKGYCALGHDF